MYCLIVLFTCNALSDNVVVLWCLDGLFSSIWIYYATATSHSGFFVFFTWKQKNIIDFHLPLQLKLRGKIFLCSNLASETEICNLYLPLEVWGGYDSIGLGCIFVTWLACCAIMFLWWGLVCLIVDMLAWCLYTICLLVRTGYPPSMSLWDAGNELR